MLQRRTLLGANVLLGSLATVIAIPILVSTIVFGREIARAEAAARFERVGIVQVVALVKVLRDAARVRAARTCGKPAPASEVLAGSIADFSRLQARTPFAGVRWARAMTAWQAGGPRRDDRLVADLMPLFFTVSDRSGMTYDPEIAGINLDDALVYRLPRAVEEFDRIGRELCVRSDRVTTAMRLARSSGAAAVLLEDAYGDITQAMDDRVALGVVRPARDRARDATTAAFALLRRTEGAPSDPTRAAAQAAVAASSQGLNGLIDALAPALDDIIAERIRMLHRRHAMIFTQGALAMMAAALFVFFGARSLLQRAELRRVRQHAAALEYHANHDALTGLPNRDAFVRTLNAQLAHAPRAAIAVLFIDLDNLKLVNDSLGHAAGDIVVRAVAQRLAATGDERSGDLIARFGGDEFVMLVRDLDSATLHARLDRLVQRILERLSVPVALGSNDHRIAISASIGIASRDDDEPDGVTAMDLLRDADAAMYTAKSRGRAQAANFGPAMRESALRTLQLTSDLRGAVERGEFVLAREPIVRLADAAPVAHEALIRWDHPRLGRLWPGSFLPVADECGAIVEIGRWVVSSAIAGLRDVSGGVAHINLSVSDLVDETLAATIARLLDAAGVSPQRLAIEVTEGSLIRSGDRAEGTLRQLRALGTPIYIDDFGVEYSSLRYLDRLPIDGIKIDRSFVSGGEDGELASPTIVRMIVELAASLGLDVVAEGIETERQRAALLRLGCARGQGFLFTADRYAERAGAGR